MSNYKMDIAYDGTDFYGWQRQKKGKTVQGKIEEVISQYLQEKITLVGAGRTDSGVHAEKQVANFHSKQKIKITEFENSINKMLGSEISIKNLKLVRNDFSARFNAKSREYVYRISTIKNPLQNRYTWNVTYNLNFKLMNRVINLLSKQKSFKKLTKAKIDLHNFNLTIYKMKMKKQKNEIHFTIKSSRFLQGMVRGIVGLLVDVGREKITYEQVLNLFKGNTIPIMYAPACGLCLKNVYYSKINTKIEDNNE